MKAGNLRQMGDGSGLLDLKRGPGAMDHLALDPSRLAELGQAGYAARLRQRGREADAAALMLRRAPISMVSRACAPGSRRGVQLQRRLGGRGGRREGAGRKGPGARPQRDPTPEEAAALASFVRDAAESHRLGAGRSRRAELTRRLGGRPKEADFAKAVLDLQAREGL